MNDSFLSVIYANQKKFLPAFEIQLLICCSHSFPIELGKEVVYFLLDSSCDHVLGPQVGEVTRLSIKSLF